MGAGIGAASKAVRPVNSTTANCEDCGTHGVCMKQGEHVQPWGFVMRHTVTYVSLLSAFYWVNGHSSMPARARGAMSACRLKAW